MAGPAGLVIATDGIVGAGKTATARRVAQILGYRHLDTGAMYRAVTLAAGRRGIKAEQRAELAQLLAQLDIELQPESAGGRILLDGEDISAAIRLPEISRSVGPYADEPLVRRDLVARQQALGVAGGVVAEGRDVGTVVFPRADLKIRLVADLAVRARRRHLELVEKGVDIDLAQVEADVRDRDRQDAERDYGAATDGADAIELDTTELSLEEQVGQIVSWAKERGG